MADRIINRDGNVFSVYDYLLHQTIFPRHASAQNVSNYFCVHGT